MTAMRIVTAGAMKHFLRSARVRGPSQRMILAGRDAASHMWFVAWHEMTFQAELADLSNQLTWLVTGMGIVTDQAHACIDGAMQKGHSIPLTLILMTFPAKFRIIKTDLVFPWLTLEIVAIGATVDTCRAMHMRSA
jgi:hypothetical protein